MTSANCPELMTCAVLMLLGAMLWGYVVGTFVSVVTTANPDLTWYRGTLDQLNHFIKQKYDKKVATVPLAGHAL